MCGRFALKSDPSLLAQRFGLFDAMAMPARYNVAPTQAVPVVRVSPATGRREMVAMRWGLIPSWADDPAIGNRLVNARSETAASKPAFREAFRLRRCIVPADGFYEWHKLPRGRKQPYYYTLRCGAPMALAGLWERWAPQGEPAAVPESFTILTTRANELTGRVHDRMPVLLHERDFETWLDPAVRDVAVLTPMLEPYPAGEMAAYPVSRAVSAVSNEGPALIVPVECDGDHGSEQLRLF